MINELMKSVLDQDRAPIVICDLEHTIVYMNESAIQYYDKYGGRKIWGQSVMNCHNEHSQKAIEKIVAWFQTSPQNNIVHTGFSKNSNKDIYVVALRDENQVLIGYYEKHESRNVDTSPFYDMK